MIEVTEFSKVICTIFCFTVFFLGEWYIDLYIEKLIRHHRTAGKKTSQSNRKPNNGIVLLYIVNFTAGRVY